MPEVRQASSVEEEDSEQEFYKTYFDGQGTASSEREFYAKNRKNDIFSEQKKIKSNDNKETISQNPVTSEP